MVYILLTVSIIHVNNKMISKRKGGNKSDDKCFFSSTWVKNHVCLVLVFEGFG